MDVSVVGQANQAQTLLVATATQQQQQTTSPSASNAAEEDTVEISADAKTRSAQSSVEK